MRLSMKTSVIWDLTRWHPCFCWRPRKIWIRHPVITRDKDWLEPPGLYCWVWFETIERRRVETHRGKVKWEYRLLNPPDNDGRN